MIPEEDPLLVNEEADGERWAPPHALLQPSSVTRRFWDAKQCRSNSNKLQWMLHTQALARGVVFLLVLIVVSVLLYLKHRA